MSHNRCDWFNPTSKAYYIRQAQIFSTYKSKKYTASFKRTNRCCASDEQHMKNFNLIEADRKRKIEVYKKIISNSPELSSNSKLIDNRNGKNLLTIDSIRIMAESLLRTQYNLSRL